MYLVCWFVLFWRYCCCFVYVGYALIPLSLYSVRTTIFKNGKHKYAKLLHKILVCQTASKRSLITIVKR